MMVCRALSPVPKLRTLKPFFWSLAWASILLFMLELQTTASRSCSLPLISSPSTVSQSEMRGGIHISFNNCWSEAISLVSYGQSSLFNIHSRG